MARQSSRQSIFAGLVRRRQPTRFARLRCEQFEDRITPALFNAQTINQPAGVNNGFVGVTDFNKDGRMDAVLTDMGLDLLGIAPGDKVTILYGLAGGTFARVQLNTGGTNVSFAAIADINGDTWPDLVATNENAQSAGTFSVFMNDGAGNLSLAGGPILTQSFNPSWIGLADVTGDNALDVIIGSFGKDAGGGTNVVGNNVTIFQGGTDAQGHGNFEFSLINTLAPEIQFIPTALAVADFNNDGMNDIAAAVPGVPADSGQPQPNGSVYVFRGTGSGGFAPPDTYDTLGALPVNIQAADVNGDNKKDLIIANAGDPNSNPLFANDSVGVLLNFSSGGNVSFGGVPIQLVANCYGTFAVAVADFNLDGKQDIAAVNFGDFNGLSADPPSYVAIYLGNGSGGFSPGTPGTYLTEPGNPNALPGGQYLAVCDYDHNGTPDLIVAQAFSKVGLLVNTSVPSVVPAVGGTTVNAGQTDTTQRSRVTSLSMTFNTQVTFAGAIGNAFTLTRNGGGAVSFIATANVVGGVTVVTLNGFTGAETQNGSLRDGRYTLTAIATQISAGGQQMASNFTYGDAQGLYRFYGDMNADRRVDISDFGFFSIAYQQPLNFNAALDYNGDGRIDIIDFGQFSVRYFTNLP